ncbi:MAG: cytidine deaminase [Gemmatimonadetes bacterium]|nr:cytidine deaminase [Gemmatimonadota bacterium]
MEATDPLVERARSVRARAYAPYSGFPVGAAIEADDGAIFEGCNVENASYGLTICAERVALATGVAAGRTRFRKLALVTGGAEPVAPCGACRQVLAEFAPDLEIVSAASVATRRWRLAELLPAPFRRDKGEGAG